MNMNIDHYGGKPFDLLGEFGKFGGEHRISLNDPETVTKFSCFVSDAVSDALSDQALVHGLRVEAMFEALLLSLGGFSLLKPEDNGRVFPDEHYRVPDFRVVLPDGAQWLIEVKNAYIKDPRGQKRRFMTRTYWEKLKKYASATGGQLKLAIYWARWRVWTLVSPERFVDLDGNITLDLGTAMTENELVYLGDQVVGTVPPLRIRLEADPGTSETVAADGTVNFTISAMRIYVGEEEILDPTERGIVWMFMQYGEWTETGPVADLDGDRLLAVEFRWDPEENANQGFATIGTLSRIFCRYYSDQTLKDQEVVQLYAPPRPGWFAPLAASKYEKKTLPLWQFNLYPKFLSPPC